MSRATVCRAIFVLFCWAALGGEAHPQFGAQTRQTDSDSKPTPNPPRRPAATARARNEPASPAPEGPGALPPSLAIEIPEEPRTIDPATLLPPELTRKSTVAFEKTPFKEVVKWLRDEAKLNVVVDPSATLANHLLSTEPVTDSLRDEPIYFLLDRLETLDLGWHIDEGVLFLESLQESEKHRVTISYNLGGLFDAGFLSQPILDSIEQDIAGPWDLDEPGTGTLVLLGDVLFVRQPARRSSGSRPSLPRSRSTGGGRSSSIRRSTPLWRRNSVSGSRPAFRTSRSAREFGNWPNRPRWKFDLMPRSKKRASISTRT